MGLASPPRGLRTALVELAVVRRDDDAMRRESPIERARHRFRMLVRTNE
jgi:hypothetical protein